MVQAPEQWFCPECTAKRQGVAAPAESADAAGPAVEEENEEDEVPKNRGADDIGSDYEA